MDFKFVHLSETDSTNRWLREHGGAEDMVVWTDYQTDGHGCGTNRWESERGKNLLYSVLLHPRNIPANRQFLLTVGMALAVKRVFDVHLEACAETEKQFPKEHVYHNDGARLTVKWPNDIYWHDRKLGGILTEGTLTGSSIRQCIIGVGVNLNQMAFHGDAPNPVSVAQIAGELPRLAMLQRIIACFGKYADKLEQGNVELIMDEFLQALYRREGFHPYRDKDGEFEATIATVTPQGEIGLCRRNRELRFYAFKEVEFLKR